MKQVINQKWKSIFALAAMVISVQGIHAAEVRNASGDPLQMECQVDFDNGIVGLQRSLDYSEGAGPKVPGFSNDLEVGLFTYVGSTKLWAINGLVNRCVQAGIVLERYYYCKTLRFRNSTTDTIYDSSACQVNNRKVCKEFVNTNATCATQPASP